MKEKLTVIVITYNHIKYFSKCMDSILSQKTNFEFKIHIFDDKSTDGTTDLVKEYAKKYPNKVKAFIAEENRGVVGNIYAALKSVDTEYYASIESDDFWCDDYKLQKQVDILDNNLDCSFCGHNTLNNYPETPEHKKNGTKLFKVKTQKVSFPKKYNKKEYIKVHPSSRVCRTSCLDLENVRNIEIPVWDSTSYWWFLSKGKLYYIDEVMSVYNRTSGGVYALIEKKKRKELQIKNTVYLNKEFDYKYNNLFLYMLRDRKVISLITYLKLKYFTKPKNIETEICKTFKDIFPIRIYTSVAENNLGDILNYYLLEYYGKAYLRADIKDANLFAIGSVLDKLYLNKRLKSDSTKEVKVLGSGFISDFERYSKAKPSVVNKLARKINPLALRGQVTKARLEKETGIKLDNIVLGDPGLLVNRLVDVSSITKKYDVGIIPHYKDKKSEYLKNIKLNKYSSVVVDISGNIKDELKKIASCRVIISSAMHGLISADSLGVPNQWIELSDEVFGAGYKFKDYYSVFGIDNPKSIDLRKEVITDETIDDILKNYKISNSKVNEIANLLENLYKKL